MANEMDIVLRAKGGQQVQEEIKKIPKAASSAARAIGNSSKQSAAAIKAIEKPTRDARGAIIGFERSGSMSLGKLATSAGKTERAFGKVSAVAVKVKGTITDIGRADGFDRAEAKARRYWQSVDTAAKKTENLQRSMEKTRNFGAGMAAGGAAGIMASRRFIEGAKEDTAGTARFEAMMNKRGQGSELPQMSKWIKDIAYESAQVDDDPIKQASTALLTFGLNAKQIQQWMPGIIGQARVLEQDLVSVAEQAGKAFAKGDIGGLQRAGVTIDPADVERMKSINDHAEKQAMLFDLVKQSFEQYALSMTEGMSAAEVASNRATLAMDDMNTAIGVGALNAENQVKSLGVSIAGLILPSQDAGEAAGYIGTIGSYAAAATGGVLGLTSQVGLTMLAFPGLGAKGAGALGMITKAAGVAKLAVGALAIPLAAVLTTAYGVNQTLKGMKDVKMDDEALKKKHGVWGSIWAGGGNALGNSWIGEVLEGGGFGHTKKGDEAEKQSLALSAKMRANGGKVKVGGAPGAAVAAAVGSAASTGVPPVLSRVAGVQIGAAGEPTTKAGKAASAKAEGARKKTETALAKKAQAQQRLNAILAARNVDLGEVDIEALNDRIAVTTDAATKAGLSELKRRATRYQRNAKAGQAQQTKEQKYQQALEERIAQSELAIAEARLEERFATAEARLEAMKGDKEDPRIGYQLAQLQAQKIMEAAQLEAKYSDSFAESGGLDVAKIKAGGIMERAAMAFRGAQKGKGGIGGALAGIIKPRNPYEAYRSGKDEITANGMKIFGSAKAAGFAHLAGPDGSMKLPGGDMKPLVGSGSQSSMSAMSAMSGNRRRDGGTQTHEFAITQDGPAQFTGDGTNIRVKFKAGHFDIPNVHAQMARRR